jgi:hypothetical protein
MLFLAEVFGSFLHAALRTRRDYVMNALLAVLVTVLAVGGMGRVFGQPLTDMAPWSLLAASCVAAGYALAYPFVRGRLAERERPGA